MNSLMRGIPTRKDIPQFDSAAGDAAQKLGMTIDDRAALAAMQDVRRAAMAIALQIADDISNDALGEDLPSERLDSYMQAAMDLDEGETADESVLQVLSASIADAMSTLGCSDDLIADCFNEDTATADSALESASDTILTNLPDDGDAVDELSKNFIYGFDHSDIGAPDDDEEAGYDSMKGGKPKMAGKTTIKKVGGRTVKYKAVKAIRGGKLTIVNKRVAGTVRLSAAQRAALNKARIKAMVPSAFKKAHRSVMKGIVMRIYGKNAGGVARMHSKRASMGG